MPDWNFIAQTKCLSFIIRWQYRKLPFFSLSEKQFVVIFYRDWRGFFSELFTTFKCPSGHLVSFKRAKVSSADANLSSVDSRNPDYVNTTSKVGQPYDLLFFCYVWLHPLKIEVKEKTAGNPKLTERDVWIRGWGVVEETNRPLKSRLLPHEIFRH